MGSEAFGKCRSGGQQMSATTWGYMAGPSFHQAACTRSSSCDLEGRAGQGLIAQLKLCNVVSLGGLLFTLPTKDNDVSNIFAPHYELSKS